MQAEISIKVIREGRINFTAKSELINLTSFLLATEPYFSGVQLNESETRALVDLKNGLLPLVMSPFFFGDECLVPTKWDNTLCSAYLSVVAGLAQSFPQLGLSAEAIAFVELLTSEINKKL
jgi:hypothetical protein